MHIASSIVPTQKAFAFGNGRRGMVETGSVAGSLQKTLSRRGVVMIINNGHSLNWFVVCVCRDWMRNQKKEREREREREHQSRHASEMRFVSFRKEGYTLVGTYKCLPGKFLAKVVVQATPRTRMRRWKDNQDECFNMLVALIVVGFVRLLM